MIIENQYKIEYNPNKETQKIKCPKCSANRKNKTDTPLSVDTVKRVFKCHNCGFNGRLDGYKSDRESYVRPVKSGWSRLGDEAAVFLKGRGFSIETITANKIIQKQMGGQTYIGYPYFILEEEGPVNIKWRSIDGKNFSQEKNAERVLYNIKLWHGCSELIIVEGENDVIACNEAGFWNVTTLSDGAININDQSVKGKLTSLHNSYEYLKDVQTFILATDNDPAGKRLKDELISVFGAEKCKAVDWKEFKDANDVLVAKGKEGVVGYLSSAAPVPISGIFTLNDRQAEMLETFRNGIQLGDKTYMGDKFDEHFRWKRGQSNLWIGYANMGKSTFLLQLCLTKSLIDGWKWGVFCPENYPADDFYNDLVEMYVGKHISNHYGNKMREEEYLEACAFINDHIFFIYPEEGHTVQLLHEKFSYLIMKHGIDGVIIDPYNQVEKTFSGERSDIEVSDFMKTVNRFAMLHNIIYNIVLHPKNLTIRKSEEFKAPEAHDIALGAMWSNSAYNILSYHRPKWFEDKALTDVEVHIQKLKRRRTGGKWGVVEFDWDYMASRYYVKQGGGNMYPCDPTRKEVKELNETWNEEYRESAVKPNELFTSSQDIKEQREDGLGEVDDIYQEINENKRR